MTEPLPETETLAPHEREWPHLWQRPFLYSLSLVPDVTAARRHARVSKTHAYRVRREDTEFAEAWDEALDHARDFIQRQAHTWITTGVPIKQKRTKTVTKTLADGTLESTMTEVVETEGAERSATLMIFWLKAWYPDRYRWADRIETSGPDGGAIQVETLDQIDRSIAELTAQVEANELKERAEQAEQAPE